MEIKQTVKVISLNGCLYVPLRKGIVQCTGIKKEQEVVCKLVDENTIELKIVKE